MEHERGKTNENWAKTMDFKALDLLIKNRVNFKQGVHFLDHDQAELTGLLTF